MRRTRRGTESAIPESHQVASSGQLRRIDPNATADSSLLSATPCAMTAYARNTTGKSGKVMAPNFGNCAPKVAIRTEYTPDRAIPNRLKR